MSQVDTSVSSDAARRFDKNWVATMPLDFHQWFEHHISSMLQFHSTQLQYWTTVKKTIHRSSVQSDHFTQRRASVDDNQLESYRGSITPRTDITTTTHQKTPLSRSPKRPAMPPPQRAQESALAQKFEHRHHRQQQQQQQQQQQIQKQPKQQQQKQECHQQQPLHQDQLSQFQRERYDSDQQSKPGGKWGLGKIFGKRSKNKTTATISNSLQTNVFGPDLTANEDGQSDGEDLDHVIMNRPIVGRRRTKPTQQIKNSRDIALSGTRPLTRELNFSSSLSGVNSLCVPPSVGAVLDTRTGSSQQSHLKLQGAGALRRELKERNEKGLCDFAQYAGKHENNYLTRQSKPETKLRMEHLASSKPQSFQQEMAEAVANRAVAKNSAENDEKHLSNQRLQRKKIIPNGWQENTTVSKTNTGRKHEKKNVLVKPNDEVETEQMNSFMEALSSTQNMPLSELDLQESSRDVHSGTRSRNGSCREAQNSSTNFRHDELELSENDDSEHIATKAHDHTTKIKSSLNRDTSTDKLVRKRRSPRHGKKRSSQQRKAALNDKLSPRLRNERPSSPASNMPSQSKALVPENNISTARRRHEENTSSRHRSKNKSQKKSPLSGVRNRDRDFDSLPTEEPPPPPVGSPPSTPRRNNALDKKSTETHKKLARSKRSSVSGSSESSEQHIMSLRDKHSSAEQLDERRKLDKTVDNRPRRSGTRPRVPYEQKFSDHNESFDVNHNVNGTTNIESNDQKLRLHTSRKSDVFNVRGQDDVNDQHDVQRVSEVYSNVGDSQYQYLATARNDIDDVPNHSEAPFGDNENKRHRSRGPSRRRSHRLQQDSSYNNKEAYETAQFQGENKSNTVGIETSFTVPQSSDTLSAPSKRKFEKSATRSDVKDEPSTASAACYDCGCKSFAPNAFKPGVCINCFHKHVI